MKIFLKRLRSNAAVSAVLYQIARPIHDLAGELYFRTSRHILRNGGTAKYDGVDLRFPKNVGVGFLSAISWRGEQGFEPETWSTLRQLITSSATFIDVGSNIGFYSVLAKRIAPQIDVLSFEPVPELCNQSRAFHAANGVSANIHQLALSDTDGQATLFQPNEIDSSASTVVAESWQARKKHTVSIVKTAKLDTFLSQHVLRTPLTIKIDVEDHEAAVLRGASETIRRYRPSIVCEILPRPIRPGGRLGSQVIPAAEQHQNAATVSALADLGYAAFAITAAGYFRFNPKDFHADRPFIDFLLLPEDELDSGRNYFRELPPRAR